jgi:hypothetical protein
MMVFGAAMIQLGHFSPPEGDFVLPLGSEERNIEVVRAAGFDNVEVESIDLSLRYPSFERYWEVTAAIGGPPAVILKSLPEDEQAAVRSQVEEYAAPFRRGGGLVFASRRLFVHAS